MQEMKVTDQNEANVGKAKAGSAGQGAVAGSFSGYTVEEKSNWSPHGVKAAEVAMPWTKTEDNVENKQGNIFNVPIQCFRCKETGHHMRDCKKPMSCDKCGKIGHDSNACSRRKLYDYVAPLCATQVEGQAFFYMPDHLSEQHVREKMNISIVTVMSGYATAKQIEEEFTRILSGVWRWTTRKVEDNKFLVRFPTAQLIKE